MSQLLKRLSKYLFYIRRSNGLLRSHNIGVRDILHIGGEVKLYLLRCRKIGKQRIHYALGKIISRTRKHTVARDAALTCDTDIGSTRTYIYKRKVK